jgi:hypothetical protein
MKTFPRHQHLRLSLQRTSGSFCSGLLSYYYYLCVLEAKGPLHVRWAAIPNATGPSKIGPEGGLIRQRTRGTDAQFAAFPVRCRFCPLPSSSKCQAFRPRSPAGANKDQKFFKPEVIVLVCLMYES